MGHRRWLIAFWQMLSQSNPFLSKTHQSGWIIYIKKWPTIPKWAMYFLYLLVFPGQWPIYQFEPCHESILVYLGQQSHCKIYVGRNRPIREKTSNNDGHFGPYSSIPWTLSRSEDTCTYMPHLNQLFLWFNSFEVTFNLKSSEFRNILELGLNYNGSTQRKINFMVIIQGDNLYFP